MSVSENHEPIHSWFGLTYANYLVLPRSVLQSMPQEWQSRFVACLEELQQATVNLPTDNVYDVRVLAREPMHLSEEPCETCDGEGRLVFAGIDYGADEPNSVFTDVPCPDECNEGMVECDRRETAEEVGVITDPIPHYSRGRTRVELSIDN